MSLEIDYGGAGLVSTVSGKDKINFMTPSQNKLFGRPKPNLSSNLHTEPFLRIGLWRTIGWTVRKALRARFFIAYFLF